MTGGIAAPFRIGRFRKYIPDRVKRFEIGGRIRTRLRPIGDWSTMTTSRTFESPSSRSQNSLTLPPTRFTASALYSTS